MKTNPTSRRATPRRLLVGVVFAILMVGFVAVPAEEGRAFSSFGGGVHRAITMEALRFLRSHILDTIEHNNHVQDEGDEESDLKRHFDQCHLIEGVDFINWQYRAILDSWRVEQAAADFGALLHTVQDFYAHANWVELGFPRATFEGLPFADVGDLIDFSTRLAGSSGLGNWGVPEPLDVVRDDIRLDDLETDDHVTPIPEGWSITYPHDAGFPDNHVPLVDEDLDGEPDSRLLMSHGYPSQCNPNKAYLPDWSLPHDELNKDKEGRPGFEKAGTLALLQTQYEWCRLLSIAANPAFEEADGLLLSLWVDPDLAYPAETVYELKLDGDLIAYHASPPCFLSLIPGPIEATVQIEEIRVLDSGASDDTITGEPGEVNLSLVAYDLYDRPFDLDKAEWSEVGPMDVESGNLVPSGGLPGPLTLCLAEDAAGFSFALHGWDDDDFWGSDGEIGGSDDLLFGIQRRVSRAELEAGVAGTASSDDLEVRYRVLGRTDDDGDELGHCDEAILGTDPSISDTDGDTILDGDEDFDGDALTNAQEITDFRTDPLDPDSDDDLLLDGTEVNGSNPTDPLDSDSDDDGLTDGQEDANANGALDPGETNPNDADSDDDLLLDGTEVNGSNPTDPLDSDSDDDGLTDGQEDVNHSGALDPGETNPNDADSDDDELKDGLEVANGSNPLDPDSDDDGIPDGEDVEWLQNAIARLATSVFKQSAPGLPTAMLSILDDIERMAAVGDIRGAVLALQNLRRHVDGCGPSPDRNDWILDCPAQVEIRGLTDLLIANLGG